MKRFLALLVTLVLIASSFAACTKDKDTTAKSPEELSGTVVVYCPHEEEPMNAGIALFEKAYPNVTVEAVAAGTGELLARIEAEAENPNADVMWGGGADSLAAYNEYFESYKTDADSAIAAEYKDAKGMWSGESPLPMVFCYNTDLVSKEEMPTSWEGLLDEKWAGKIAYANPAKSGSSYTQLCTMIQLFGGEEGGGWDYVSKLIKNVVLQDSSSACYKLVNDGEYPIGITLEKSANNYKIAEGSKLDYVYPEEGTSAVPDGIALVKGAPNRELAITFINFITGKECQEMMSKDFSRRPARNDVNAPEGLPAMKDINIMDYDFDWAAKNKEAIVEKFQEMVVDSAN